MRGTLPLLLNLGGPRGGGNAPANTVAPAIEAAAVIGTEIAGDDGTWVPAGASFTYQWKRGAAEISGATDKNYTPVDADFGQALTLVVTEASGGTATSNATALVVEAPAQTFSEELLTNGNFAAWTGDNPDGWTVAGEIAADPELSEVGSGEGHGGAGTGSANYYSSTTSSQPRIVQTILTVGGYSESVLTITHLVAGGVRFEPGGSNSNGLVTAGQKRYLSRATTSTSWTLRGFGSPIDCTIDDVSNKAITPNTQLVAPSADMRLDAYYTLPASPVEGSAFWLLPRISDWATGDNWRAVLIYTGAQWNINLYSVASNVATSRIAATNIGATNGVRVNMNGDSLSLWTTANGGTNWTQQGSTITNTTYNTATGVNALWTSDFTAGHLVYAAAT